MIKQDGMRYRLYECDACHTEMTEPPYQRNDGTYQENFIVLQGMHLCHQCGARILKHLVQSTIERIDLTRYKNAFTHDTKKMGITLTFMDLPKAFSSEEFKKEYQCNFEPVSESEPEFWLKYNKEQADVVTDGLCYNHPYGITSDSWKEIEVYKNQMDFADEQYSMEMDNENYRFVFKLKSK